MAALLRGLLTKRATLPRGFYFLLLFIYTGCDKLSEERVCLIRTALEFRMKLNAYMEAVLWLLDSLYYSAVRRCS